MPPKKASAPPTIPERPLASLDANAILAAAAQLRSVVFILFTNTLEFFFIIFVQERSPRNPPGQSNARVGGPANSAPKQQFEVLLCALLSTTFFFNIWLRSFARKKLVPTRSQQTIRLRGLRLTQKVCLLPPLLCDLWFL
jgi:hypothetical protein